MTLALKVGDRVRFRGLAIEYDVAAVEPDWVAFSTGDGTFAVDQLVRVEAPAPFAGVDPFTPPAGVEPTAQNAVEAASARPAPATEGSTGDVGEELSHNRRNRLQGLVWADVASLNPSLRVREVTKERVWPRPDYAALVADGMAAPVAHCLKQVYDAIAARPRVRASAAPTDEQLSEYIETVSAIRRAVFAWTERQTADTLNSGALGAPLLPEVFAPDPVSRKMFGLGTPHCAQNNARGLLISQKAISALQIGRRECRLAREAVEAGWPAKVSKPRAAAAEGAPPAKPKVPAPAAGQSLAQLERIGPARRMPGENIASETLMGTFGFRGVNFGNWMKGDGPAKTQERQAHLNHAYDALVDLAELLDVPAETLSLGGQLGLAFGAQGMGGAAAHFVPGSNEINLTRTAGAGALAHEFGHALDHYLATLGDPVLVRTLTPYLSEAVVATRTAAAGMRPSLDEAMRRVMHVAMKRPLDPAELADKTARMLQFFERGRARWLACLRNELEKGPGTSVALQARFETASSAILADACGDGYVPIRGRPQRGGVPETADVFPAVAELGLLLREGGVRSCVFEELKGLHACIVGVRHPTPNAVTRRTTYLDQARLLDQGKQKAYWSTPREMFARAFEAFVLDTLAARSQRNDYLVTQNTEAYAQALISMGLERGDPYARGSEREAMTTAIGALVSSLNVDPDNSTRLYRRDRAGIGGLSLTEATEAVDAVLERLQVAVGVPIRLCEAVNEAPALGPAERSCFDALTGTVWVRASAHADEADIVASLRHELIGHYGLSVLPEADRTALLTAIQGSRTAPALAPYWAHVDAHYAEAAEAVKAEEVFALAVQAPRGRLGALWDSVCALAARAFRRAGLLDDAVTPAELRDVGRSIESHLRQARRIEAVPMEVAEHRPW